VTYDETLGYPRTVIIDDGRGAAPAGTITISGFKTK